MTVPVASSGQKSRMKNVSKVRRRRKRRRSWETRAKSNSDATVASNDECSCPGPMGRLSGEQKRVAGATEALLLTASAIEPTPQASPANNEKRLIMHRTSRVRSSSSDESIFRYVSSGSTRTHKSRHFNAHFDAISRPWH